MGEARMSTVVMRPLSGCTVQEKVKSQIFYLGSQIHAGVPPKPHAIFIGRSATALNEKNCTKKVRLPAYANDDLLYAWSTLRECEVLCDLPKNLQGVHPSLQSLDLVVSRIVYEVTLQDLIV